MVAPRGITKRTILLPSPCWDRALRYDRVALLENRRGTIGYRDIWIDVIVEMFLAKELA